MERRLKEAGYEVATYPSAQDLLDRLPNESESGCILLDVRIPGLSGPELQDRLSELGSTLPIVFLTGFADVQTTVRAIRRARRISSPSRYRQRTFLQQSSGHWRTSWLRVARETGSIRCARKSQR
jgi:CheY-like chemotaxis protein